LSTVALEPAWESAWKLALGDLSRTERAPYDPNEVGGGPALPLRLFAL
jgi:hypothetical protein